jgi:hypothetical protein
MATDTSGNQKIAFEWGNIPMQPNNDRNGINLGSKGIHSINGMAWDGFPTYANADGHTLVDGDPLYIVPSYTFCWSNPKTKDGNVWDYIEYLRTVGVDPELLVEATFTGGENKYDWGTVGDTNTRAGGIIFWEYIPKDIIAYIDWETGTVYTGKDFDNTITAMYSNAGSEVSIDGDWFEHSVVAFTNDPSKNNTADWWY